MSTNIFYYNYLPTAEQEVSIMDSPMRIFQSISIVIDYPPGGEIEKVPDQLFPRTVSTTKHQHRYWDAVNAATSISPLASVQLGRVYRSDGAP